MKFDENMRILLTEPILSIDIRHCSPMGRNNLAQLATDWFYSRCVMTLVWVFIVFVDFW